MLLVHFHYERYYQFLKILGEIKLDEGIGGEGKGERVVFSAKKI